jgi:hypothetical protein
MVSIRQIVMSTVRRRSIGLAVFCLFASSFAALAVSQSQVVCLYGASYKIVWDGWEGRLNLYPTSWNSSTLDAGGVSYRVRQQILVDPQNFVDGRQGPGFLGTPSSGRHRIVFWVDFNRTPNDPKDDQRFDGYFFNQGGKRQMAGVTWWANIPFGFYAIDGYCIPG